MDVSRVVGSPDRRLLRSLRPTPPDSGKQRPHSCPSEVGVVLTFMSGASARRGRYCLYAHTWRFATRVIGDCRRLSSSAAILVREPYALGVLRAIRRLLSSPHASDAWKEHPWRRGQLHEWTLRTAVSCVTMSALWLAVQARVRPSRSRHCRMGSVPRSASLRRTPP